MLRVNLSTYQVNGTSHSSRQRPGIRVPNRGDKTRLRKHPNRGRCRRMGAWIVSSEPRTPWTRPQSAHPLPAPAELAA